MKVEVQPEEAVEELQSEAAQEEDEEEEEEQDEAEVEVPLTQQERLHKFILWYIGEQRITLGHKFTGDRQNTLQQALIDHGITDMLSFVISKIQQHLKDSRSTL
jgi:hypothetical protein